MKFTGFHNAVETFHRQIKQTCQIHLCNEIDVDQMDRLRQQYKDDNRQPPSYTAMIVKAIAMSINEVKQKYPEVNSMLVSLPGYKRIHTFDRISGGVAVARDGDHGLDVVYQGVFEDPQDSTLRDITARLKTLSTGDVDKVDHLRRCRSLYRTPWPLQPFIQGLGWRVPSQYFKHRGTFSLTTVGKFGVDYQLTLPQTSTLQFGFGLVRERPVVRNHEVVAGRTLFLSLSFDRRVMNGRPVSAVMHCLRKILNGAHFESISPRQKSARKETTQTLSTETPQELTAETISANGLNHAHIQSAIRLPRLQSNESSQPTKDGGRAGRANGTPLSEIRMKAPILIFSEGISFCHIIRPLIIAGWLKDLNIPIRIACPERATSLFADRGFSTIPIHVANPVDIYKRLAEGKWLYEIPDLLSYFEEDEKVIRRVHPRLIVSDFRFSALQLAKKYAIPSVGITSASCHPHFAIDGSTPDPFVSKSPLPLQWMDRLQKTSVGEMIRKMIIKQISSNLIKTSEQVGVERLESFFEYASQGDICLLADHPDVMPISSPRPGDIYTGPLIWERDDPLPSSLIYLRHDMKRVYISIGTQESLDVTFLNELLPRLIESGFQVILSKGKRKIEIPYRHQNLFVVDFINESKILPLVDLFIYSGSAMSTYQGLYYGVPMIAIPVQVDQHYHAEALVRKMVGTFFRPSRLNVDELVKQGLLLVSNEEARQRSRTLSSKLLSYNGRSTVIPRIERLLEANAAVNEGLRPAW